MVAVGAALISRKKGISLWVVAVVLVRRWDWRKAFLGGRALEAVSYFAYNIVPVLQLLDQNVHGEKLLWPDRTDHLRGQRQIKKILV
jgi:hypothetical protein